MSTGAPLQTASPMLGGPSGLLTTPSGQVSLAAMWPVLETTLKELGGTSIPAVPTSYREFEAVGKILVSAPDIPDEQVDAWARDATNAAHDAAREVRKERMRQARSAFNGALALAVIGTAVMISGAALLFFGTVASGAITVGGGAISNAISVLLFRLSDKANDRLDEMARSIMQPENARAMLLMLLKIRDDKKRDDAIAKAALGAAHGKA